ncbi:M15 family metallopeptidase [Kineosporia sp. NBRC 101677]|nr:M15 family metallopeptidase [Kineosporia sp. NBRC 101677]
MADPMPKAQVNQIASTVSVVSAVSFPNAATAAGIGVENLAVVPAEGTVQAATPNLLAAPKTIIVSRASRAGERSVLPGCSGIPTTTGASNGQLPESSLCTLWDSDHRLRADAAVSLAKLNIAYKQEFGNDICLTDSYRTLSEQYAVRASKPTLSAVPGTSEHGWGLAVDLCDGVNTGTGARFQWLADNASSYGWENPDWAKSGGGGPYEPWHWEYAAGQ